MAGLKDFVNKVFLNIIKNESANCTASKPEILNRTVHAGGLNKSNVSLLIKTCAQDVLTIEENIKHIIRQTRDSYGFLEKTVLIDCREKDFLRGIL